MRSIASKAGFSSAQVACFSTHSLRFGGASTLLAAGVDRYQIQLAGRWKSDAFMVYLLAAHSLFERTQSALSDAAILSFQSVRSVSTSYIMFMYIYLINSISLYYPFCFCGLSVSFTTTLPLTYPDAQAQCVAPGYSSSRSSWVRIAFFLESAP